MKTTKCTKCNADIEYKTRPPSLCTECKTHPKGRRKSRNTQERQMFYQLDKLFPGQYYIRNGYYSFLMSPKGAPMQLDIYYPNLNIAFEFDGSQHIQYNTFFFKNKGQFADMQSRDRLKDKICRERGITLIRVNYTEKITVELLKQKTIQAGRQDLIDGGRM